MEPPVPPPLAAPSPAAPPALTEPRRATRRCLDCGERVEHAFCGHCGQEFAGSTEVSTGMTFYDLIDDAIQVNRSFFYSVYVLVTKPGELTMAYLAGQRTRYVSPAKLYLVTSFVYFLILQWFGLVNAENVTASLGKGAVLEAALAHGADPGAYAQMLADDMSSLFATWLFLLVPAFAGVLKLFYRRRKRSFAAHAVFAFHTIAFVDVAGIPQALVPHSFEQIYTFLWAFLLLPVWSALAVHRVYDEGWKKDIAKALGAWTLLFLILTLYYALIGAWIMYIRP